MEKRRLLVFAFVLVVMTLGVISAANINLVLPATNSTNFSGSSNTLRAYINGTGAGDSSIGAVIFYYQPWSYTVAANGTWITITNVTNSSQNQTVFSTTWNTAALADGKNYTLNATAFNWSYGTINLTNISGNMTVDNTPPVVNFTGYTNATSKKNTDLLTLNISVADVTVGLLNTSNSFCFINVNGTNQSIPLISNWCNSTLISLTGLSDGNVTINVYSNDTLNNLKLNNSFVVNVDTTGPTAIATCNPTTIQAGEDFPCSCSASDATAGISTSGGSSTSGSVTSTADTGVFTYTCSVIDNAGNSASDTMKYTVNQPPTNAITSVPKGSTSVTVTNSFGKVTPETPTIITNFDSTTGVKEIQVEVNKEAMNIQVSVTKFSARPVQVTVEKTGRVYQYLQIEAKNLLPVLDKANVEFKVEKSWASTNNLNKDKIAVSKFNESSSKWYDLGATFNSEDDKYFYYDVELHGFSYFAISEKIAPQAETPASGNATAAATEGTGMNAWWWVAVIVIIILVAWIFIKGRRNHHRYH